MSMSVGKVVLLANFVGACRQLKIHPLRSFLTILGITIGMASLISMMGIGEGTRQRIIGEMERLGDTGTINVQHKRPAFMEKANQWMKEDHLTLNDLEAFKKASRYIEDLAPVIFMGADAEFHGESFEGRLFGTTPEYASIRNWTVAGGRFLLSMDLKQESMVCVLGSEVSLVLFGDKNPIGEKVLLNGRDYTVVGTMARQEFEMGRWLNDLVVVPRTTMVRLLPVQDKVSQIVVRVSGFEYVSIVKKQLRLALERRHEETEHFTINSRKM